MDDIRDSAAFVVSQLGWEKLKELQLKVITAFVTGQDVFAVRPTAMGKAYAMHVYHYSSIISIGTWNFGDIISTAYTVHCGILHESPGSYIN